MQLGGILVVVQHTHRQKNVRWLFSLRFRGRLSPGMRVVMAFSLLWPPITSMSARNWGKLQDGLAASYDQKWAAGSSQYGQLSPIDHQNTAAVPATRTSLVLNRARFLISIYK